MSNDESGLAEWILQKDELPAVEVEAGVPELVVRSQEHPLYGLKVGSKNQLNWLVSVALVH